MGVSLSCLGNRMNSWSYTGSASQSTSSKYAADMAIDKCASYTSENTYFQISYTRCSCTTQKTIDEGANIKDKFTERYTYTVGGHPNNHKASIVMNDEYSDGFGDRFGGGQNTSDGCKTYKYHLSGAGEGGTTIIEDKDGTKRSYTNSHSYMTVTERNGSYTTGKVNYSNSDSTYYSAYDREVYVAWYSKRVTSKAETYTVPEIIYTTDLSGKTSDLQTFLNTSTRPFTTWNRVLTSEVMYTDASNHYTQIERGYYDNPYYYAGSVGSTFHSVINPFHNILTTIICDDEDFVVYNDAKNSYAGNHSYSRAKKAVINQKPPLQDWLGEATYSKKSTHEISSVNISHDWSGNDKYVKYKRWKKKTEVIRNWDLEKWENDTFKHYQIIKTVAGEMYNSRMSFTHATLSEVSPYESDYHRNPIFRNNREMSVNWLIPHPESIEIDGTEAAINIGQYYNPYWGVHATTLNIKGWLPINAGYSTMSTTHLVAKGYTGLSFSTSTLRTSSDNASSGTSETYKEMFTHAVSYPRMWAYYQPTLYHALGEHFLLATNIGKVLPEKAYKNFIQGKERGTSADYHAGLNGERWPMYNIFGDTRIDNHIGAEAYRHNQAKAIGSIENSARNYKVVTTHTDEVTIAGKKIRTTKTNHLQSFGFPSANFTDIETAKQFWSFSYTDIVKTTHSKSTNKTGYKSSSNKVINHALGVDYNRSPNASTLSITKTDETNWKEAKPPSVAQPLQSTYYGPVTQNGAYHSASGVNSHGHESFNVGDWKALGNIDFTRRGESASSTWLEIDNIDRGIYGGMTPAAVGFGMGLAPNRFTFMNGTPDIRYNFNLAHRAINLSLTQHRMNWRDYYVGKDDLMVSPIGVGGLGYDGSPFTGYIGNYYKDNLQVTSYKQNSNGSFDSYRAHLALGRTKYVGTEQTFFAINPFQSLGEPLNEKELPAGTPYSIIYNPFATKRNTFTDTNILSNNPEYFIRGMDYQDGVITKVGKPAKTNTSANEDAERVTFVEEQAEMPITGEQEDYYKSLFKQVSIATWDGQ